MAIMAIFVTNLELMETMACQLIKVSKVTMEPTVMTYLEAAMMSMTAVRFVVARVTMVMPLLVRVTYHTFGSFVGDTGVDIGDARTSGPVRPHSTGAYKRVTPLVTLDVAMFVGVTIVTRLLPFTESYNKI